MWNPEKRFLAQATGLLIGLGVIYYHDAVGQNYHSPNLIALKTLGPGNYHLYASCAAYPEALSTIASGYTKAGEIMDGKSVIASTDTRQIPIRITKKTSVLETFGLYQYRARFAKTAEIEGSIICFPPIPFRAFH